jgi:hypothetical protein
MIVSDAGGARASHEEARPRPEIQSSLPGYVVQRWSSGLMLDDMAGVSGAQQMLVGRARLAHGLPESLVLDEDRHRRAVPVDDGGNLVCGS